MNTTLKRQACYNLGYEEPISIEPDGVVWLGTDPDRVYPDMAPIDAEYEKLLAEQPKKDVEHARLIAYENESDPIFFKWQRGDATEREWLNAVQAVKDANPYPPAP